MKNQTGRGFQSQVNQCGLRMLNTKLTVKFSVIYVFSSRPVSGLFMVAVAVGESLVFMLCV